MTKFMSGFAAVTWLTFGALFTGCIAHVTGTVLDSSSKPLPPGTPGVFSAKDEDGTNYEFKATSGQDGKFRFDVTIEGATDPYPSRDARFQLSSNPSRVFTCKPDIPPIMPVGDFLKLEIAVPGTCTEVAVSPKSSNFTKPTKVLPPSSEPAPRQNEATTGSARSVDR